MKFKVDIKTYNPGACDVCTFCKIQHLKKYQETYWKCKLMKYKECWDSSIPNFTIFENVPSWCPLPSTKNEGSVN